MKIGGENNYNRIHDNTTTTSLSTNNSLDGEKLPAKGQVLKGELTDVSNQSIAIKLSNGEVLHAKVADHFNFNIGEKLTFLVKDSNANQLILTPLTEGENQASGKLVDILNNANITVNEHNLNVLQKLLDNNLSIDNQSLSKMVSLTKQHGDVSVDLLVFMNKNGITINSENINQLQLMTSGENQIVQSLATLSDDLSSLITTESEGMGNQIAKLLLKDNHAALDTINQIANNQETVSPEVKGGADHQLPLDVILSGKDLSELEAKIENILQTEVNSEGTTRDINVETNATNNSTTNPANDLTNNLVSNSEISPEITSNVDAETVVNTENNESVMAKFSQLKTVEELLDFVKNLNVPEESKEDITNLIARKVSYGLISKEVLMNREDLDDPSKLNDFYNKLNDKINDVLNLNDLANNSSAKEVYNEATNIKNAIGYMDELGDNFTYLQLPMMLEDKLLNSEFYVFNNKRELKSKNQTITALVRLDLANLGHLDIYISKTGQDLECKFYTESNEKSEQLEPHTVKLHNKLNSVGFKVRGMSVSKLEKNIDILEEINEDKKDAKSIKRYSFDMRA